MILLLDALVLGCVVSLPFGGRIHRLGAVRLRFEALLVVLFALQLSLPRVSTVLGLPPNVAVLLWVTAMLALAVVALFNHRHAGLVLVSLGISLNALAIVLNGAMPVSEDAVSVVVGYEYVMKADATDVLHEPLRSSTVAAALSDVIPLSGPSWHRGVISVGDVLIAAGTACFVFVSMTNATTET